MSVMVVWGMIVSLVLFFFGGALFMVFLPERELLPLGIQYLRILSVCEIAVCIENVGSAAFRGSGQTRQSAIASISSNCLRVVLAYVLSKTPMGIYGVFVAVTFATIVRGGSIVLWYYKTRRRFDCVPAEG